ncbi:MAG: methyltransferase domain-containing protein [Deltaproteobacteria bacterium]|nr:methyltransferase domain-containing protein [Deltaproteobacteria bacterium]
MTEWKAERRVRAYVVRALEHKDFLTVLGQNGAAFRFEGDSGRLVRAILDAHLEPVTFDELVARLSVLSGTDVSKSEAVREAYAKLVEVGVLVVRSPRAPTPAGRRVVLGVSGAAAALHTPQLVTALMARGHTVRVAATRRALRFFTAEAVESITHARVVRGIWDRTASRPVPHVELAEWAELILVAPASAATLSRLARGAASDIVSAICLASRAPVVIAPSMHVAMWSAPATRRNVEALLADGCHVVEPIAGVELAHAPDTRSARLGPSPPPDALAALVGLVSLPEKPIDWDRFYRDTPLDRIPWLEDPPEDELRQELAELFRPGARCLDLGCGAGALVVAARELGYDVVGMDRSATALSLARARADRAGVAVSLVLDDARHPAFAGEFELVIDRGLLHTLDPSDRIAYAEKVARFVRSEGHLVIKVQTEARPERRGVHPVTLFELDGLFGREFSMEKVQVVEFDRARPATPAAMVRFRRRGEEENGRPSGARSGETATLE